MVLHARSRPARANPRRRSSRRWSRSRRGVSDVVATILILALTVVLFASLFAFVSRFPAPPAQAVNQFQASVTRTTSAITGVTILQDGGPPVPGQDKVYLQSSRTSADWQFSIGTGIPVTWGLGNATSVWSTGQSWTTTFATSIKMPANITIYIVSSTQLLYSGVVPGATPNLPPILTDAYTVPGTPTVGGAFQLVAIVSGNTTGLSVNVSLAEVPGLPSATETMAKVSSSEWVYNVTSGLTTKNGTYLAFIQGVNATGATISGSASITLSGSSGGGGSSVTVQPGMSPQPPTVPQQSPSAYFWATITYTGTKTSVPVSVNFTVSQTVGGRSSTLVVTNTIPGQTGLTITGPSSLTVYSQTADNFNSWLLNSSVTITATATLGQSVGSATGSIAFATANYVQGIVYVTTSSSGSTTNIEHTFSHTCNTGSSCPYIYASLWDNFTTALGGPATVNVSGIAYANSSAHSYEISGAALGPKSVTEGSTLVWNLYGGTTRENQITSAGTYTLAIWLTVRSTSTTGAIIGYIYDTFALTVS